MPQAVVIAILTFQRSARLRALLPHVTKTLKTIHDVQILVVDNNPLPNEQKFVKSFAQGAPFPVDYLHSPEVGVSNARNAAVNYAKTRFLAFLDDDMQITESWLDDLIRVSLEHQTGVVFGPITAKFKNEADPQNSYLAPFYTRYVTQTQEGPIEHSFGTGGCLLDLQSCVLPNPAFDTSLNESGGEDDILFQSLRENGTLFGWAPTALCYECVPEERTTNEYIAKRNFGYGQGPSRLAAAKGGVVGAITLLRHMIIGSLQACIYGSVLLLTKALKRPSQVRYLALTNRGLGKVFWFNRFQPKLYGTASIDSAR